MSEVLASERMDRKKDREEYEKMVSEKLKLW